MSYFGSNIRYLRKKAGMGQDELADLLGYKSFTTIQKWESGVTEPTLSILLKLSKLFNVDMDDLAKKDLQYGEIKETKPTLPDFFTSPQEAVDFLLKQNVIMGYNGLDITKLSEEEQVEYANEILNQIKLVSYKYKD